MIYKYFLPFSRLHFHFINDFPCCTESLYVDIVPLFYLCFVAFAWFHWSFLLSSYSISALLLFFPSFYKFWALLILFLVPWVVNIGYFFKFFLISWGSHLSLWTSLLELLLLHSISFGILYFHFHLSHGIFYNLSYLFWAFQVALVVKNLPTSAGDARDTHSIPGWGRSPAGGNGNPLQYSWRIPWTEEPGRLQSIGSQRVGHDWSVLACIYFWLCWVFVAAGAFL